MLRGDEPGPRVQREQHSQARLAELIVDGLEALRLVGVLRAVDGGQN
jgi:hypothetical protein